MGNPLAALGKLLMNGLMKSSGFASWFLGVLLDFLWDKLGVFLKQQKAEKETVAKREEKIKEADNNVEEAKKSGLSREERRKRVEDGFNSIDS